MASGRLSTPIAPFANTFDVQCEPVELPRFALVSARRHEDRAYEAVTLQSPRLLTLSS
jgi:hypothetical protein